MGTAVLRCVVLLAATPASATPPIIVPPTGPIATPPTEPARLVTRFVPGTPQCGGTPVAPRSAEEPLPAGSQRLGAPLHEAAAVTSLLIEFRIDAAGRPLGIRTVGSSPSSYPLDTRDVVPAFAAWRFAPGAERRNCTIAFTPRSEPVESADAATLRRYLALQRPGIPGFSLPVGKAAFDRVRPAGSTCTDEPTVRLRAYPAFEEIAQAAGTRSYSFLAHDIDASGRPRNVRLLGSDGNAELDRRSIAAINGSRFAPGARTGCIYYYFRGQPEPMRAPETPPPATFKTAGSDCPDDRDMKWAKLPALVFPEEFRVRNIEGWAVVRFDVAPWGDVGNVSVAAAEPAAAFGERAQIVVRGAKKLPSGRGYSGCVTRVVFRLPD